MFVGQHRPRLTRSEDSGCAGQETRPEASVVTRWGEESDSWPKPSYVGNPFKNTEYPVDPIPSIFFKEPRVHRGVHRALPHRELAQKQTMHERRLDPAHQQEHEPQRDR